MSPGEEGPVADIDAARAAQRSLRSELAGTVGVNGIGLTRRRGEYALKVGLTAAGAAAVPDEVDGVPVVVEVVGPVRALGARPGPAPAGPAQPA